MEKILIVEDEMNIVRLLRDYLEQAGFNVWVATNGETCLHMLQHERPDLILLDLGLPDKDGWDLTRIIRADFRLATIPIIMLTARVEDSDKIIGLELGADDYITKPFNPREVVARVRAILRRLQMGDQHTPKKLTLGDLTMDLGQHTLTISGESVELTPTEFDILHLFIENPGYTYTREELLEKTLGYAYEGTGRTLDTHIKNLRQKIEPDPHHPTYIQTVHRIGYRFAKQLDD
jgi:two-component system alkaline phosphatase synthesis response regulator PhoP